jgi:hypothetical protein
MKPGRRKKAAVVVVAVVAVTAEAVAAVIAEAVAAVENAVAVVAAVDAANIRDKTFSTRRA